MSCEEREPSWRPRFSDVMATRLLPGLALLAGLTPALAQSPSGFDAAGWIAQNAPFSDIRSCFRDAADVQAAALAAPRRVVLAVDASVGDARGVAETFLAGQPPDVVAGLVTFGQRPGEEGKAECASAKVVGAASSPAERAGIATSAPEQGTGGAVPLAGAIRAAGSVLDRAGARGEQVVEIIAGRAETCGGDPRQEAQSLRNGPAKAIVNVIGVDPSPEDVAGLREVAEAGGGVFFEARTPAELSDWAERTIAATREAAREARARITPAPSETPGAQAIVAARSCVTRAATDHRVRVGREVLRQRLPPEAASAVRSLSNTRVEAAMLLVDRYTTALQADSQAAAQAVRDEVERDFSPAAAPAGN